MVFLFFGFLISTVLIIDFLELIFENERHKLRDYGIPIKITFPSAIARNYINI